MIVFGLVTFENFNIHYILSNSKTFPLLIKISMCAWSGTIIFVMSFRRNITVNRKVYFSQMIYVQSISDRFNFVSNILYPSERGMLISYRPSY